MSFRVHQQSPADAVEQAFFRIQHENMADVPILNPALRVEAIDFQRWQGHWLGMLVTPWCMSMLLVPGSAQDWISTGENKRRFVHFPAGDFAFLGSSEPELGEYQSCPLFSPMDKFSSQTDASMTARASLIGLLSPPPGQVPVKNDENKESGYAALTRPTTGTDKPSLSRRRFFSLRP